MKLHLGCGRNILPGWVNVDHVAGPGVDVVQDLDNIGTFDFAHHQIRRDSVEEFKASHVLEHLKNPLFFFEEMWNLAKDGATFNLEVPYGSSDEAFEDPTHVRQYFMNSWIYFGQPAYWRADYGYRGDWEVEQIRLLMDGAKFKGATKDVLMTAINSLRNTVVEMQVTLRAVKPARPQKRELLKASNVDIYLLNTETQQADLLTK